MHKKPEIKLSLPEQVEAGIKFDLSIDFDGAKLDRAEIYLLKVPRGGYKDPETGVVITEDDAKRQIEEAEEQDAGKIYKKEDEAKSQKKEREAAGGKDSELKKWKMSARDFKQGMKVWRKKFAIKPSKEDFNVLMKLKACGDSGCFVKRRFLKVLKLSDEARAVAAAEDKERLKSMSKTEMKNMDRDELKSSLELLKEEGRNKQKTCKRGQCEVKDASGKAIDAEVVEEKNTRKREKAQ